MFGIHSICENGIWTEQLDNLNFFNDSTLNIKAHGGFVIVFHGDDCILDKKVDLMDESLIRNDLRETLIHKKIMLK